MIRSNCSSLTVSTGRRLQRVIRTSWRGLSGIRGWGRWGWGRRGRYGRDWRWILIGWGYRRHGCIRISGRWRARRSRLAVVLAHLNDDTNNRQAQNNGEHNNNKLLTHPYIIPAAPAYRYSEVHNGSAYATVNTMKQPESLMQKFWRDKNGRLALVSKPNAPLLTWFASLLLAKILPDGSWQTAASLVSFGALFTWAWLEIFHGVNYFRRILGATVLIVTVLSHVHGIS
jgi:hypothetical protein